MITNIQTCFLAIEILKIHTISDIIIQLTIGINYSCDIVFCSWFIQIYQLKK